MNIQFTLTAKSFLEAAEIEETLRNNSIKYNIEGKINGVKRKPYTKRAKQKTNAGIPQIKIADGRKVRCYVDMKLIDNVLIDSKKMTIRQLINKYKFSRATVNRIISGTHTLQLRS